MPIYNVINYTRYSTEDITDLLDRIEKQIPVRDDTEPIQRRRYFSLGMLYEYEDTLHIVYTKPGENRTLVELSGSVALLKMSKVDALYDSPVEALSLAACDIKVVPKIIASVIAGELIELYQMPFYRRDVVYKKLLAKDINIRILEKDVTRLTPEARGLLAKNKRATKALHQVAASIIHMNKSMQSTARDIAKIAKRDLPPEGLSLLEYIETSIAATKKAKDSLVYIHDK